MYENETNVSFATPFSALNFYLYAMESVSLHLLRLACTVYLLHLMSLSKVSSKL